jgi:mRNA interferase HigB
MRIITKKRLAEFAARHPEARSALEAWHDEAARADWHSLIDVRRTYPHADAVRVKSDRIATVFNIKRNDFRLITAIHYDTQRVFVMRFLTHAEYSKNTWKDSL